MLNRLMEFTHENYNAKQKENFCWLEPIYNRGLPLIPTWISNHLPSKVLDEIIYPSPNFNSCTVY